MGKGCYKAIADRVEAKGVDKYKRIVMLWMQQECNCLDCICYYVMLLAWVSGLCSSSIFFQLSTESMSTVMPRVWSEDAPLGKHRHWASGKEGKVLKQSFGGFMDTESRGLGKLTLNSNKITCSYMFLYIYTHRNIWWGWTRKKPFFTISVIS